MEKQNEHDVPRYLRKCEIERGVPEPDSTVLGESATSSIILTNSSVGARNGVDGAGRSRLEGQRLEIVNEKAWVLLPAR